VINFQGENQNSCSSIITNRQMLLLLLVPEKDLSLFSTTRKAAETKTTPHNSLCRRRECENKKLTSQLKGRVSFCSPAAAGEQSE
jgi:hypothetical protein